MFLTSLWADSVGIGCNIKAELQHNSLIEQSWTSADPIMETARELLPFIREVLSQKPSRGLLKVYLVGSVLAVLGSVLGLLELFLHPFSFDEPELSSLVTRQDKRKLSEITLGSSANRIHTF